MVFDDLLNDAQAKARTGNDLTSGVAGAEEPIKYLSLIVGRNSDATILAGETDSAGSLVQRTVDGHRSPWVAELDRVGNNVV